MLKLLQRLSKRDFRCASLRFRIAATYATVSWHIRCFRDRRRRSRKQRRKPAALVARRNGARTASMAHHALSLRSAVLPNLHASRLIEGVSTAYRLRTPRSERRTVSTVQAAGKFCLLLTTDAEVHSIIPADNVTDVDRPAMHQHRESSRRCWTVLASCQDWQHAVCVRSSRLNTRREWHLSAATQSSAQPTTHIVLFV